MSHRPGSLCGNNDCPCAKPGAPCLGFEDYGSDDYDRRWCARCGWENKDHPTADDLRHTPAGKQLLAEGWEAACRKVIHMAWADSSDAEYLADEGNPYRTETPQ